jgi:predicted  nucleic acid-binding Zn-ribbon protein
MQNALPELQDTDAKHERALAKLAAAEANLETVRENAREHARRVDIARQRLQTNREELATAQRQLTEALGSNMPTAKFQQTVAGCRANVDSLEALLVDATRAATEADKLVGQAQFPIGQAQQEITQTRFYQLIAQLAKVLPPAIKICRELIPLGHQLGTSLEQSGYVLDLQRPNIGRYRVNDDGSLYYHLG